MSTRSDDELPLGEALRELLSVHYPEIIVVMMLLLAALVIAGLCAE